MSTTLTEDRSAAPPPVAVVRGLWVREAPLALDGVVEPRLLPLAACCWLVRSRRRARGETATEGNSSTVQGEDGSMYAKECGEIEVILRINSARGLN